MESEVKYKIENDTLIVESCPNGILDYSSLKTIVSRNNNLKKIYICEGVEEIGKSTFRLFTSLEHIKLPKSLKKIGKEAFNMCQGLQEIVIPEGVVEIDEQVFRYCDQLEKVYLPDSITSIKTQAFFGCEKLKEINLPNSLEIIESLAFSFCHSLESFLLPSKLKLLEVGSFAGCNGLREITIPEGIKELNETFTSCKDLEYVKMPSSLKKIGENTFFGCWNLKKVEIEEGLETIGESAFSSCVSLENIKLPESLKKIGADAFAKTNLIEIKIPNNVESIERSAFVGCSQLESVTFSENLKKIDDYAFRSCEKLKLVEFPDSVRKVGRGVFSRCSSLEEVILSSNLKTIEEDMFLGCIRLKRITIPDGIKEIKRQAFVGCVSLKEVKLPSTIEVFDDYAFSAVLERAGGLNKLILNNQGEEIEIRVDCMSFLENANKKIFLCNPTEGKYSFYNEGKYIEINQDLFLKNKIISNMIEDGEILSNNYINLYYWANKKFIPSDIIIKNMPIKDIDNFFVNKNYVAWKKLLGKMDCFDKYAETSFFKLCYVLGIFSKSTAIRDKAINFIKENIVGKVGDYWIHSRCDGFDLSNGFNEEYSEFFMKYYDGSEFLKMENENYNEIDLMAASYNNFSQVKNVYPNKTLHTNRKVDLLLPEHVMSAVRVVQYYGVDTGNNDFAIEVGKYGYTQSQFERLQEWYNAGKSITEMKLFISEDEVENGIKYKFLEKDDPRCAILGNISNCCQVIAGAGESCVEYGMTKPNSGFITFNYKDRIIGQSWVWYDEESKTVCLDNIEIPHRYLEKINQNKEIQKSFVECLLRIEKSFKEEMNKRGLKVNKVTIGKGYNDIKEILDKSFELVDDPHKLTGYPGYSDASSQYEIKKKSKSIVKK